MNLISEIFNNKLFLILFGSILTLVTTSIIEYFKGRSERLKKKNNLELLIKLELSTITKTLEKIQTALSYVNYYDYLLLDRADKSIENLQKSREEAIYLSDSIVQEKFIDVVSDVSSFLTGVRNIQNLYYDEINKTALSNKSNNNKGRNNKKSIQQQSPKKTPQQIQAEFNQRKTEKTIEYVEIKRRLDDLIKDLQNK